MNKKQAAETADEQIFPWGNPRFRSWIAVGRACHLMQTTLSRALQPLDLKTPHLDILVNLYRFDGLTQQELARKLLVGRSNMSMLLPQLEKRGLIERRSDASDRRVLRLTLTKPGRSLTEQAMAVQMKVIERSMEISSPEECEMVGDVMSRMIMALKEDLE